MKKLALFVFLTISSSAFAEDIYRLQTKIGNQVFNDIFVYKRCDAQGLIGSMTVPGMFSSPTENGKCNYTWTGEFIRFNILVRENNEEYYVSYNLSILGTSIGGSMRRDNEIIGTINGELIFSNNE